MCMDTAERVLVCGVRALGGGLGGVRYPVEAKTEGEQPERGDFIRSRMNESLMVMSANAMHSQQAGKEKPRQANLPGLS